jgi:uncharacterized protein (DUF849 family)
VTTRPPLLKACLNGSRLPAEHPRLPVTPQALACEAAAAVAAGAGAVHVHPKDADGVDTLDAEAVAAVVTAIRAATPAIPVGVTTGAWALPDPDRRVAAMRRWRILPDFASVNWHEAGAADVATTLFDRGIGVEAGLWHEEAIGAWLRFPGRLHCLRVLLEVDEPIGDGVTQAAALVSALGAQAGTIPVLLHGADRAAWPVLRDAVRRGLDVRIGLEDVLTLPDGSPAAGNADLVAAARALLPQ